jgi:hypothetical protein
MNHRSSVWRLTAVPRLAATALLLVGCAEAPGVQIVDNGVGTADTGPADQAAAPNEGFLWPDLSATDAFVWPDGVPDLLVDDSGGKDFDGGGPTDGPPTDGPAPCVDGYEPNSTCAAGYDLGSTSEGSSWVQVSATLYPLSDPDWYGAKGLEGSHVCFPFTSQCYTFSVKVDVPTGRRFKLCVYEDSCSVTPTCASNPTLPGPTTLTVQYTVNGTCTLNDDTSAKILVEPLDLLNDCLPYKLSFNYDQC